MERPSSSSKDSKNKAERFESVGGYLLDVSGRGPAEVHKPLFFCHPEIQTESGSFLRQLNPSKWSCMEMRMNILRLPYHWTRQY